MKIKAILTKILSSVGQLVIASILWTVCSLPLFTMGAATSSLYYCVVKTVRRENGNILTDFFRVFKEGFWQALPVTMIFLVYFTLIAFFDVQHFHTIGTVKLDTFIIVSIGFTVLGIWSAVYAFPSISRFYYKGVTLFRFITFISVKHFITTLLMILLFLGSACICISNGVFLIIVPGLYNYCISFLLEPIFRDCSSDPDSPNYKTWYSNNSDKSDES